MPPQRYGPFPYVPMNRRPRMTWPNGARVALWVVPYIETFPLSAGDRATPDSAHRARPLAARPYSITALALWGACQDLLRSLDQVPALLVLLCGPHPQRLPVPDGPLTTAEKYPPHAFCQSSGPGRTSREPWTTHDVARRGPASRHTADTAAPTPPRSGVRLLHS